ncbi:MAG: hypothetical protein U0575_15770 [Phycisphaerales bacterium]
MSHANADASSNVLKDHDDPEPGSTWFIGLAGAIVLTALVLGISVLYYGTNTERVDQVVVDRPSIPLERLRAEQQQKLVDYAKYTFTDPDGKTVERIRIPVKDAMAIVLKEKSLGGP